MRQEKLDATRNLKIAEAMQQSLRDLERVANRAGLSDLSFVIGLAALSAQDVCHTLEGRETKRTAKIKRRH